MGLFSSKKKTTVGTTVTRVIEDDMLPNSPRTGITKGIFARDGEGSIPDFIVDELLGSLGPRVERMYAYAKNHYHWGIPSPQLLNASEGVEEVTEILEVLEAEEVVVEYSQFGPPNSLHLGWMELIAEYDYNPITNQIDALSTIKGTPVFLHDMVVVVPSLEGFEPGALDQFGIPPTAGVSPSRPGGGIEMAGVRKHTPVNVDALAIEDHILVTYCWVGDVEVQDPNGDHGVMITIQGVIRDTLTLPIAGLADDTKDYFHVKYAIDGAIKYWMYEHGSGTHPTIDAIFETAHTETGQYFPFAYFRFNKTAESTDPGNPAYATTKKLVKYIGMDYDEVVGAINENPDIGDVEQAMLTFAVPAEGQDPLELRYLWDFFDQWATANGTPHYSPEATSIAGIGVDLTNVITIQDTRFKMTLGNGGIYKRRVPGSIGAIGTHTGHITTRNYTQKAVVYYDGNPTYYDEIIPVKYHVYRKQVSVGIYEEIEVTALTMQYFIIDGYQSTADGDDNTLMIPLDRSITRGYSLVDREVLYARALHFIFNSVVITKIRWYQTGLFKFIMIVVALIITIFSSGLGSPALAAAIAAGGVIAAMAILNLLVSLLINVLIGMALKLFVKALGIQNAFILAIVAVVAAYSGYFNSSAVMGMPWADVLLATANGLVSAIQGVTQELMGELVKDANSFTSMVSEQDKALKEANKLLESDKYLSPVVIFGESPDEFFNRTVHSGNIGIVGISAISHFVDNALKLPKLNDTLGDEHELSPV